jgi:cytochrome c biogenesis protein CcdA
LDWDIWPESIVLCPDHLWDGNSMADNPLPILEPNGSAQGSVIHLSPVPIPLTIQYAARSVTMHSVNSMELDAVASLNNSIHLTFFGLCAGSAITFAVVLTTASIASNRVYAAYVGLFIAASVLALYFGIRGGRDYFAAKRQLKELKSGMDR